jgi:hypothetical protein
MSMRPWIRSLFTGSATQMIRQATSRAHRTSTHRRVARVQVEELEPRAVPSNSPLTPNLSSSTPTAASSGDAVPSHRMAPAVLTSTPLDLQATGSPQGKINASSNGSIDLRLTIDAGQLDGKNAVANLFDGVNFTIWVHAGWNRLTYTATAKVTGNGDITLSLPMDDALKAALDTKGILDAQTVNFRIIATANGGDYALDVDITALVQNNNGNKTSVKG